MAADDLVTYGVKASVTIVIESIDLFFFFFWGGGGGGGGGGGEF